MNLQTGLFYLQTGCISEKFMRTSLKNMRQKNLEKILHIIFWALFIFTKVLIISYGGALKVRWEMLSFWNMSYIAISAIVFYVNYFLFLPKINKKNSLPGYAFSIILSYFLFIIIRFSLEEKLLFIIWGFKNYYGNPSLLFYMKDNLYFSAPSIIFSTTIWSIINNMRLIQENALIKIKQSQSELKFLKAKINPHFVFNSLNNIYSLVYQSKHREPLQAIESLAGMMRFMTYESDKESVALQVEVDYIKNLISLEKLRHNKELAIAFNISHLGKEVRIPPFILSPFIENAFKHGVADDVNSPITIMLEISGDIIFFSVKNKISVNKKEGSGGFGLHNVQERLNIYYPGKHELTVNKENDYYIVSLKIKT